MKKLLDFEWLRAVQFKCNTSAKSVTSVQITKKVKLFKTNKNVIYDRHAIQFLFITGGEKMAK